MEVLPCCERNKRKLKRKLKEVEEEEPMPPGLLEDLVLTPSPESNEESEEDYSITKLDDIIRKKEGQLEILQRPKRVFRDYYGEEEDGWGTPVCRGLREDERLLTPSLRSNIVSDYPKIIKDYREEDEGQLKILQSARRVFDEKDERDAEISLGQDIVVECFGNNKEAYFSSDFFSGADVDAEFLKSHLSFDLQDPDDSEDLERVKGYYYPDWEELAKYVNQLRKSEGFDLDKYENLGPYAEHLPINKAV